MANKEAIFAPWSLRRLLGLKNLSDGVEAANQMVVSAPQWDGTLMFWRERGSGRPRHLRGHPQERGVGPVVRRGARQPDDARTSACLLTVRHSQNPRAWRSAA